MYACAPLSPRNVQEGTASNPHNPTIRCMDDEEWIAASDGVPFFKDRNAANGWPVVMYPENGPVGVASSNDDAHMVGSAPSEYLTEDEEGKRQLVKKYAHKLTHDMTTDHT